MEVLDLTLVLPTLNIHFADNITADTHQIMQKCKSKYLGYGEYKKQDKKPSLEEF